MSSDRSLAQTVPTLTIANLPFATPLTGGDLQVVSGIPVFKGLRPESVQHIIAPATITVLGSNETLFACDSPATAFYILVKGYIKLVRHSASGKEAIIRIMGEGDSVAEASALTGGVHLATAQCVSESRVVCIPADHVICCIQKNPEIALAMIASSYRSIGNLMQHVEQLKANSGVQRIAAFLVTLTSVEHGPCEIVLPYEKSLIAARIGLKAESLSRAFGKLKQIGVRVRASKVSIKDINKLHQLVDKDRGVIRGRFGVV
jgi:CRP-like cAMP-binding protein